MDFEAAAERLSSWKDGDKWLQLLFAGKLKGDDAAAALEKTVKQFEGTAVWKANIFNNFVGAPPDTWNYFLVASMPSKTEALALLKSEEAQASIRESFSALLLVLVPKPNPAIAPLTRVAGSVLTTISSPDKATKREDGRTIEDGPPPDFLDFFGTSQAGADELYKRSRADKERSDAGKPNENMYMLSLVAFKDEAHQKKYGEEYGFRNAKELLFWTGAQVANAWTPGPQFPVLIDTAGLGPPKGYFEEIGWVKYPTTRVFLEMITSDKYAELNPLRKAGIEGGTYLVSGATLVPTGA